MQQIWNTDSPLEDRVVSHQDIAQDAWVFIIRQCKAQGRPLPTDATMDQLRSILAGDGGLVQNAINLSKKRRYRERRHASLETAEASYTPSEYGKVEDADELSSYLRSLEPGKRKGVRRFIKLWEAVENGSTLAQAERTELSRLRKSTGLPLAIKGRP